MIATADPLPGRNLPRFSQKPMDGTTITNEGGTSQRYWGHDEMSTSYSTVGSTGPTPYRGTFMADNFAVKAKSTIVHVKWWGSYLNNYASSSLPIDKFLICFEADVPTSATNNFSYPGQPLLSQIVQRGELSPGSGTFTERPISAGGPPLNETLFEYNAELHLTRPFNAAANTVYWLKIVALLDIPAGIIIDPYQPPSFVPRWGWHNRDYRVLDPFAPVPPVIAPGEHAAGMLGSVSHNQAIWHFQDAAVTGRVVADHLSTPDGATSPVLSQAGHRPTRYVNSVDGPSGIGEFSQDLGFELYALGTESRPTVGLSKAVKPALSNLVIGVNYQLQVSANAITWTNHGGPFTATNDSVAYPHYWDVDNWNRLFFRARAQ